MNMDGFISPIDVALVVNHLNSAKPAGEGEAAVAGGRRRSSGRTVVRVRDA
ncbi:MAG: hypothetical protein R3C99_25865 [Pirellulaceae bacterium]